MAEYIERSDAIMAITRAKLPDKTENGIPIANGKRSVTDCIRRIKAIPSADVQPVVRCKDCVHFQKFRPHDGFCKIDGMLWNNDFFCANGMREEN